ncbi:MAG: helix-turn-helix domain-containing protein [Actinomycetia bacterium]|nr:helix-turn-helix domain-containing protein [Actinomycetes bacterium]
MEPTTKALHDYPELMTVAETAAYLRIAISTCYLLTNTAGSERSLPAVKVGGRTFILRDRLADYLALGTS